MKYHNWKWLPIFCLAVCQVACSTTSSLKRYSPKPISKEEIAALEKEADNDSYDEVPLDVLPLGPLPENARERLQIEMDKYLGVPYRYGGSNSQGMDCSGFVFRTFQDGLNIRLPRSSAAQARVGVGIRLDKLNFGDLVFFKIKRNKISHVGIYLHNGHFIHASTKLGVIVSSLHEPYYKRTFATARRLGNF